MTIAIVGYYNKNNAGDDRILECLTKKLVSLGIDAIEVFEAWDDLNHKIDKINQCDFLLIGGGGLILRKTNRVVELLKNVQIPFGFIGISVDSVGEDNEQFIKYIADHSTFVLVRDDYSFQVFRDFNASELHQSADLTFLYPYKPTQNKADKDHIALSLRGWKPNPFKQFTKRYHRFNHWTHKLPFLPKLLKLWNEKDFVLRLKQIKPNQIIPFPLHFCDKGCDNQLLANYFDIKNQQEFDISILSSSNYLIGMRLHSLIFATQLGIPFIALNYANKVEQFAKTVDMEDYVVQLENYKDVKKNILKLEANLNELTASLIEKTNAFENDVHKTVDSVFKAHVL